MDLQKPLQQNQKRFRRNENRKDKEEIYQQKETELGGKIEMVKEQSKRQSGKLVDSYQQFGEQLSPDEVEVIAPECAHIPPESRKTHGDDLLHSDCSLRTSSNRCDKQIPTNALDNLSEKMVDSYHQIDERTPPDSSGNSLLTSVENQSPLGIPNNIRRRRSKSMCQLSNRALLSFTMLTILAVITGSLAVDDSIYATEGLPLELQCEGSSPTSQMSWKKFNRKGLPPSNMINKGKIKKLLIPDITCQASGLYMAKEAGDNIRCRIYVFVFSTIKIKMRYKHT